MFHHGTNRVFAGWRQKQVKCPAAQHLQPFLQSLIRALSLADHNSRHVRTGCSQLLKSLPPGSTGKTPFAEDNIRALSLYEVEHLRNGLRYVDQGNLA